ncbi:MAG: phosphoribosyltransferase, partial [Thaumarchaeota archaeon]
MSAVVAILKHNVKSLDKLCIGTTIYVTRDSSSDLAGLVSAVSKKVPVLSCDLHLGESIKPGLQAFTKGFVKEGVGAGGASIAAMIKSKGRITGKTLLKAIEKEYETLIEIVHR